MHTEKEGKREGYLHRKLKVASSGLKHGFKLKFCPKCGSAEIHWASGLPQLWSIWECKECGYRGALVIEDSDLAIRIRERYLESDEKGKQ